MRSRPYAPCVRKLGTSWQTHRQEHHPDAPQDDEKPRAQPLDGVLLANERMRSQRVSCGRARRACVQTTAGEVSDNASAGLGAEERSAATESSFR